MTSSASGTQSRSPQQGAGARAGAAAHPAASTHTPPSPPARTVARAVTLSGRGLFNDAACTVTIGPASRAGTGLVFRRTDLPGALEIPAQAARVIARERQTVLALGEVRGPSPAASVQTVEHVLSALWSLGVSDALLDVTGPELPMMDGSALDFARAVCEAGVVELRGGGTGGTGTNGTGAGASAGGAGDVPAHRAPIVVSEALEIREGGASVSALPLGPGVSRCVTEYSYALDYGPDAPIRAHSAYFELCHDAIDADLYLTQIAPARTFCTEQEARMMAAARLHAHLKPSDVLVIGAAGPIENTLRFGDEPARHKVLDLIGDLALTGRPIHGRIVATRSGHALNQKLAAALLARAGG